DLSLFFIWDPTKRLHLFSELDVVEQDEPDVARRTFQTARLYGDLAALDWLDLRVGKFLTPVGRWNLIHARPLVWTTSRPLVTELPFDRFTTGAMLFGSRFPGTGTLTYSLYGQFTDQFDAEPEPQAVDRSVGGRLEYASLGGWSVGGSYLSFTDAGRWRHLTGLDTLWQRGPLELMGEFAVQEPARGAGRRSACTPSAPPRSTSRMWHASICGSAASGATGHRSWRSTASRGRWRVWPSRTGSCTPIRPGCRRTGTSNTSRGSSRRACCPPVPLSNGTWPLIGLPSATSNGARSTTPCASRSRSSDPGRNEVTSGPRLRGARLPSGPGGRTQCAEQSTYVP